MQTLYPCLNTQGKKNKSVYNTNNVKKANIQKMNMQKTQEIFKINRNNQEREGFSLTDAQT